MMRTTGSYDSAESSGAENDEMVENDNSSLADKIDYLEKKILEQGDEIICLRSTLANVVRRLEQVEAQGKTSGESWNRYGSATKNGASRIPGESGGLKTPGYGFGSKTKEPVKRSLSTTNNALHQRRQTHYQSTNSLHSGQSSHSEANSSNSASPVPISPSASTHSNSPGIHPVLRQGGSLIPKGDSIRSTQSPSSARSTSNLQNSKRWSSTGDFGAPSQIPSPSQSSSFSRSSAKSLLNLYPKHQMSSSCTYGNQSRINDVRKTEITYNEKEGVFRMYIMGSPVVLYIPTPLIDVYDLNSVTKPPTERLKLDWVYGYRGRDCRSNLYYLPTGEMVYFVAAVVVLYNVEEQSQRHYLGHTDDVKCLAVHPNKMLVATGQCASPDRKDSRPHIRVWNSVSLHTVSIIGLNEFEKSICCLTFSKVDGGALLCAIDESFDHVISIWDWQRKERGAKLTENKCSVDTVVAAEFHPLDRHCVVTCGKSHIAFWILDQNGTLYKRMGVFENRDKPKYVTCLSFTQNGDTLSGDSNGNIIVWGRGTNTMLKLIRGIHESTVLSICVLKDGAIVTGGGKDGKLALLNSEYHPVDECYIAEQYGGVRQVSESRGSQLLVGTTKNCILIGSVTLGFTPVMVGHTDEVWACSAHPKLPQFVTAGFEGNIHFWDSMAHSLIWTKDIGEPVQSVRFTPDGCLLVVGLVNGKWVVLDCTRREIVCSHQDGNEPILDCKFSPDGGSLALASRDSRIYIYESSEDFTHYSKRGRLVGHTSFVTRLDWSADSQFIRSNSGNYELLYWQESVCRQITHTLSLRDVEWATNDCIITFNTIGIWQEGTDGTDLYCTKSHDSRFLATGDDCGKIKLYTYPVIYPKSLCHSGAGHSSQVTNVEFLHDDSRLVSLGGKDTGVLQWKIS